MPGCAIIANVKGHLSGICNHNRAVDFYAESVENPEAFVAVAANSYQEFAERRYDRNDVTYMGIACRNE
jgi:L-lysine 2,3-aminomutase